MEFLRLDRTQRYFRTETRTVAQPTLNIKQLSETPVFLPPLPIQEQFSNIVVKTHDLKSKLMLHLGKLEALFASLQDRAFRGELIGENAERELALVG